MGFIQTQFIINTIINKYCLNMRSKIYEILLIDFTNPGVENQRTVYVRKATKVAWDLNVGICAPYWLILCLKGHKICLWDENVGILVSHKLDVLIRQVLAHNWSPVIDDHYCKDHKLIAKMNIFRSINLLWQDVSCHFPSMTAMQGSSPWCYSLLLLTSS